MLHELTLDQPGALQLRFGRHGVARQLRGVPTI